MFTHSSEKHAPIMDGYLLRIALEHKESASMFCFPQLVPPNMRTYWHARGGGSIERSAATVENLFRVGCARGPFVSMIDPTVLFGRSFASACLLVAARYVIGSDE